METSILAINIHFKEFKIAISAQKHLKQFYNTFGFQQVGEGYMEDGIPHIYMINNK